MLASKKDNTGTVVSTSFGAVNTFSLLLLHIKIFLRDLSGVNNAATVLILEDNWLTTVVGRKKLTFHNCNYDIIWWEDLKLHIAICTE